MVLCGYCTTTFPLYVLYVNNFFKAGDRGAVVCGANLALAVLVRVLGGKSNPSTISR